MSEQMDSGSTGGEPQSSGPPVITVDDHLAPQKAPEGDEGGRGANGAGQAATPAQEQPQAEAPALRPDVAAMLSDARLRAVPGESNEAALARVAKHYSGWNKKERGESLELKQQVREMRQMMEGMARAEYQRMAAAQREQQMASMPDPEIEPEKYNRQLLEAIAQRELQREQQTVAQRAEEERLGSILDVDEAAFGEVEDQVNADPEAAAAYEFATDSGRRYVSALYPDAPEHKVEELVALVQQNEIRMHHERGLDYIQTQKAAMHNAFEFARRHGYAQAPQQPIQAPPQQQPAPQPQQPLPPRNQRGEFVAQPANGSATAQRLQAESAQARARQAVASPGRVGAAPTGEGIDLRQIPSEEDYVRLRLSGAIKDQDYDQLAAQQFGRGRVD